MISGNVNQEMLDQLNFCANWKDLVKTNYPNYLDETFSEYMKSIYKRINSLKDDFFKNELYSGSYSINNTKINIAKLTELKKCRNWQDFENTGYAKHIDKTFEAYLVNLYQKISFLTKTLFKGTEKTIWTLEKELFLKDLVTLGRGKNPTDKIEEFAVENLDKYENETSICDWPIEIPLSILQFLSPEELCKTSGVSKEWYKLTWHNELWKHVDLKKLYPNLNFISQKVWEKHVDLKKYDLTFNGNPGVHKRNLLPVLKELFDLKIEGVTLITLPKGFTDKVFFNSEGKETISKTKIVAVTNSVTDKERKVPKSEYPDLLPIMATSILTSETSEKILYSSMFTITSSGAYFGYEDSDYFYKQFRPMADGDQPIGVAATREIQPDVFDDTVLMDIDEVDDIDRV